MFENRFGGAHEAVSCLRELNCRTYLFQASRQAEHSLTCIHVSFPVYLRLLLGFSAIEAVIFWMCPPPHGSYLGFPHISMGNCEIHFERIKELQVPVVLPEASGNTQQH